MVLVCRSTVECEFQISNKQLLFLQLEEQKFEMDRLKRELEEKMAEVTRVKATLQSSEMVSERLG